MATMLKSTGRVTILAAALVFCLNACATPQRSPEAAMWLQRATQCVSPEDCQLKWGRALAWASTRTGYRVVQANDMMIATAGPMPNSPMATVSIIKTAGRNGRFDFTLQARCDNIFGCLPPLDLLQADFTKFIYTGEGLADYSNSPHAFNIRP